MKKTGISLIGMLMIPALALAQYGYGPVTNADSLFATLGRIGNMLIVFLIGVAVIFIVWNTVQFIYHAGGEKRAEYQKGIIWGIVGLFVILSIWGLVAILSNTFGTGNTNTQFQSSQDVNSIILHPTN